MNEYHLENKERITDEERIDLLLIGGDYWKGIKKYWWLCIILAALGACLLFAKTVISYVPMYKAESTFTVTLSQSDEFGEENSTYGFYYNSSTASQMAKTFPYILKSDMLTGIVKEDLGVSALNGTISASSVSNSNLFTISVVSNNPEDAKAILESVIENYPAISKYVIGSTRFNIIEPAELPTEPYNSPNYRNRVIKGALAGLMLGLIFILVYAMSRRTIRKPEDSKTKLNLPSLGEIPSVRFKQRNQKIDQRLTIYNDNVGSAFKESLRTLTVRIEKEMQENDEKILMVASTISREGKTMAALNIAYCLSRKGKKVILIDGNLRKPEIRNLVTDGEKGQDFSILLEKGGSLEEFICSGDDGKLFILGNKNPVKNSSQLLGSKKMKQLLGLLKTHFDYIIVDTAPVGSTADSIALAEYADTAIYVIKQDDAKVWDVMDGISILGSSGVRICGCILNMVKSGLDGYGYGYGKYGYGRYGRYGYGYGYGYGKYGYGSREYGGSEDAKK